MANEPKVPECIALNESGVTEVQSISVRLGDDGTMACLDFVDFNDQLFPLALRESFLTDLLLLVGIVSKQLAEKQSAAGGVPEVRIMNGKNGQDLPPIHFRLAWTPETQKLRFILGNAGLEFPLDASSALAMGEDLVRKARPFAKKGGGTIQ